MNLSSKCRFCRRTAYALWRCLLPHKRHRKITWLALFFSRLLALIATFFLLLTLIFSVLPVPFSAYMVQQKISHCLQGEAYPIQYRWVSLDKIAWQMQLAVIAAEDQKFKSHFGVDFDAIVTALKQNENAKKPRGASTISQQTVKNLYLWHGSSWLRKGIELPLTFMVEAVWDKKRVLEVYLNIAEFGNGIFGVEAAAQHFFRKPASRLTQNEAALLAASLPNPLMFKVDKPSAFMRQKQQWIIRQMNNLGGADYLQKLAE